MINSVQNEFDQKSGNWKYPRLSFVQYLVTGYLILQIARLKAVLVPGVLRGGTKSGGDKSYKFGERVMPVLLLVLLQSED